MKDLITGKIEATQDLDWSSANFVVNQIFKTESFYFFKSDVDFDQKQLELKEISRLKLDMCASQPLRLLVENPDKLTYTKSYLLTPVVRELEIVNVVISFFSDRISIYEKIVRDYRSVYTKLCSEKNQIPNSELNNFFAKMDSMTTKFEFCQQESNRFAWMKFKRDNLKSIDEYLIEFNQELKTIITSHILHHCPSPDQKTLEFESRAESEFSTLEKTHQKTIKKLEEEAVLFYTEHNLNNPILAHNKLVSNTVIGLIGPKRSPVPTVITDIGSQQKTYEDGLCGGTTWLPIRAKVVNVKSGQGTGTGTGEGLRGEGEGTGRNLIQGQVKTGRGLEVVVVEGRGRAGEGRVGGGKAGREGGRLGKFCCCFRYRTNKVEWC